MDQLSSIEFSLPCLDKNKKHSTIFACATADFQKSKKCEIFKNALKIYPQKNTNVWCFSKSARPVCNHLLLNSIKTTLKSLFFFKKCDFSILNNKKKCGGKNNSSETPLNFCQLKCTYLGRKSFEPRSEKTGLQGFRPGPTKPGCTATEDG